MYVRIYKKGFKTRIVFDREDLELKEALVALQAILLKETNSLYPVYFRIYLLSRSRGNPIVDKTRYFYLKDEKELFDVMEMYFIHFRDHYMFKRYGFICIEIK